MALYKDEPIRHRDRTPCDAKGRESAVWSDDMSEVSAFEQQCSRCGAVTGQRSPTRSEVVKSRAQAKKRR